MKSCNRLENDLNDFFSINYKDETFINIQFIDIP